MPATQNDVPAMLLMPVGLRQALFQFFNHGQVIAPSALVIQLMSALAALKPAPKEKG